MLSNYNVERFFYTSKGWYVIMRPGDEKHRTFSGIREIKIINDNGQNLAGPFRTKERLISWFNGFVSFYGVSREGNENYITDDIIIPTYN